MGKTTSFPKRQTVSPSHAADGGGLIFILAHDFGGQHALENLGFLKHHALVFRAKGKGQGPFHAGQEPSERADRNHRARCLSGLLAPFVNAAPCHNR